MGHKELGQWCCIFVNIEYVVIEVPQYTSMLAFTNVCDLHTHYILTLLALVYTTTFHRN